MRQGIGVPLVAALLGAVALSSCTSTGRSDADRLALYRAHAGEAVPSFRIFGRLNSWTPLGDSAVAVWTRPGEAWLLELSGRCPELPYSQAISVTSNMNTVYARFDRVMALGRQSIQTPCHIAQIQPLDTAALRQAERNEREGGERAGAEPQVPDSGT